MKNPKSVNELLIYRGDIEAGHLKRTETGCVFEYAQEFLKNPIYAGLSYRMPKSTSPLTVHGNNLHPFFAGLLPEGLRLKALLSNIKTSQDDLFSLFAASGSKCIGDVYAKVGSDQSLSLVSPKLREIDFYDHLKALLKENSYLLGEEAIAGVQEKISTSMISFPLNIAKESHSYILKLNPKDKPHLIENEFHCMALAKKCGIDVATVKLVKDKNNNLGLLVDRFDRVFDKDTKKIKMIHQEDACQFLDKYPSEKYRISINQIADNLKELASSPLVSILQLLRLYSFSYLIGNGDLHAKNISLHTLNDRISLTPAYDLISTYIFGDHSMALKIDGRDDNIKRKTVFDFSRRFGIEEKATKHMLEKLITDVEKHHSVLFKIPMENRKKISLEKIIKKRMKDLSTT